MRKACSGLCLSVSRRSGALGEQLAGDSLCVVCVREYTCAFMAVRLCPQTAVADGQCQKPQCSLSVAQWTSVRVLTTGAPEWLSPLSVF